jgi:hypothetical protein
MIDDEHFFRSIADRIFRHELQLRSNLAGVMNTLENVDLAVIGAMLHVDVSPLHGARFEEVTEVMRMNLNDKWRSFTQQQSEGLIRPDGSPAAKKGLLS